MCIIIAKDKIGRLPTESELKHSFEYNDDGAGFMYVDNGKVVIDKGYMTYESFIKHYKTLLVKYNNFNNKSLVIHCRIGTSGINNKATTHPYPITDNEKALKKKRLTDENIGIAHNGIIRGYGTATGLNDTQEYIKKYLYPLYFHYRDFYKNEDMLYQIEMATNSKFAILDKTDTIYYVGDFIDDKGLKFSNNTYQSFVLDYSGYNHNNTSYNGYGSYNGYDYDEFDDDEDDTWFKRLREREQELEENTTLDELNETYSIKLPKDYHIDFVGNGDTKKVGDRDYYFDYYTMSLYEKIDGKYEFIVENPIIYDENNEEIF